MSDDPKTLETLKLDAENALKEAEKLEAALKEAKAKAETAKAALEALQKAPPPSKPAEPAAAAPPKPKKEAPAAPPVSGDPETIKMLGVAKEKGQSTIFDRAAKMKPCNIGTEGICCKVCSQGPCRLPLTKAIKDGTEPDTRIGLCGATPETIVSRNLIRMVSAGSSAHADHGLELVETLKNLALGETSDYSIKDEAKLKEIAAKLELDPASASTTLELAQLVADKCFAEFGKQHGELTYLKEAPPATYERWTKLGVKPRGINREAVEIMHRTHMGVDQDYENLLFQGIRCALADGWAASSIATDIQDAFFGPPVPQASDLNLGSLSPTSVNVVVHGNYPMIAEKIIEAANLPDLIAYAKGKGADGYKITGICATGNELQERHGIPGAGDYLQQELAIITGAVEVLVVDAQCAMEALGKLCECYHTKLITTFHHSLIDSGKNTQHLKGSDKNALDRAKEILKIAADNFKKRGQVVIPEGTSKIMAGYSVESLGTVLKANGGGPLAPLAEAIKTGTIKGVVGLLGCNNVRVLPGPSGNDPHVDLALSLIKDDILVLSTGCAAMALGRAGLMAPEAKSQAGSKLAKFCEDTGLSPVIHLGSCVDNSRLLKLLAGLSKTGTLGTEIAELPAAVAIPGWTSEQIVSTAFYFMASGLKVYLGFTLPVQGVPAIVKYLDEDFTAKYGGALIHDPDPISQAGKISKLVEEKRSSLGLS
ncbi:MAG: anaerobic carbon-monoxide dehydrogenase catalytic subunit [Deltaproteobacteria bacterium]|nr:anaerobic carbon-monoxide dehydrogenase catalytic subunit [Deltaproteobacteria bacterium]